MSLNNPFFIVGCGRSGTSLLKAILSSHADIYVTPETFYYHSIDDKLQDDTDIPSFIATRWWMMSEKILESDIRKGLEHVTNESLQDRSDAAFRAILNIFQSRYPKSKIGEKSASHVRHVSRIKDHIPDAKFVQIIRDPRAVLASYTKAKIGSNQPYFIAKQWLNAMSVLETHKDKDYYYVLSYEELTRTPNDILRGVSDFLIVKWDEKVLRFHERENAGFPDEQKHHLNTLKPIFTSNIDSWKTVLSKRKIALIEYKCSDIMQKYGYEITGHKVLFPEFQFRISFLLGMIWRAFVNFPEKKIKAIRAKSRLRKSEKT